jgi:hypothetical protein
MEVRELESGRIEFLGWRMGVWKFVSWRVGG